MHYVWYYLYQYIKIGKFTLWMVLATAFLFGLRFLKNKFAFKLKPSAVFIMICVLGLLLRLGWLSYSSHEPKFAWAQGAQGLKGGIMENDIINIHAVEITEGKWFLSEDGAPSARRPVGYPVVLGGALQAVWRPRCRRMVFSLDPLSSYSRSPLSDGLAHVRQADRIDLGFSLCH